MSSAALQDDRRPADPEQPPTSAADGTASGWPAKEHALDSAICTGGCDRRRGLRRWEAYVEHRRSPGANRTSAPAGTRLPTRAEKGGAGGVRPAGTPNAKSLGVPRRTAA